MSGLPLVLLQLSDMLTLLLLTACFYLGTAAVRVELEIQLLQSEGGVGSQKQQDSGHTGGDGTLSDADSRSTGETPWDRLSWEEKMNYVRRKQRFTWAAAGAGALSILGSVIVVAVQKTYDVSGVLPLAVIAIFAVALFAMAGYLLNSYSRLWRGASDRRKGMQRSAHESQLGQKIALVFMGAIFVSLINFTLFYVVVLVGIPIVLTESSADDS